MQIIENLLIFPLDDAPTPSCHASTVCLTDSGMLISAWFGGTHENNPDVEIYMSRKNLCAADSEWETPRMVTIHGDTACWNPVLFHEKGKTTLFFKKGVTIPEWKTFVKYSYDDGISWTDEVELVPGDISGGRGPVKDKPIMLSNGTLIAGASHETGAPERCWRAFVDVSRDGGKTWDRGEYVNDGIETKLIQPTLWEDEGGVHMLMRSINGYIYRSDAPLETLEFCKAYRTDVPNNNSGIDLVKSQDGRLFLVCNPIGEDGGRSPISLLVSEDGGLSFGKLCDLEKKDGGELSYPAIICKNGELFITYTYERRSIRFIRIKL